jgi:hypothetical protein
MKLNERGIPNRVENAAVSVHPSLIVEGFRWAPISQTDSGTIAEFLSKIDKMFEN